MRNDVVLIAAAAGGILTTFLVFTGGDSSPEEETIASVSPRTSSAPRVEIEDEGNGLAEVSGPKKVEPVPAVEPVVVVPDAEATPLLDPGTDYTKEDVEAGHEAEHGAVTTLRVVFAAQSQLHASGFIDSDGDGMGEFGYLAELTGERPVRVQSRSGPILGAPDQVLDPAFLGETFRGGGAPGNGGVVEVDGYLIQVHLPAAAAQGPYGVAEAATGGAGSLLPDPALAAKHWCAYAWPAEDTSPPRRAFFINETGVVVQTPNAAHSTVRYVGRSRAPHWSAAFGESSMAGKLGQRGALDQNIWHERPRRAR